MATVTNNLLLHGLRGKLGGVVLRNFHGKTIVSALPRKSNKPPTPAQVEVRKRFRQAVARATELLKDPLILERYKALAVRKRVSPFCLVVSEVMRENLTAQVIP